MGQTLSECMGDLGGTGAYNRHHSSQSRMLQPRPHASSSSSETSPSRSGSSTSAGVSPMLLNADAASVPGGASGRPVGYPNREYGTPSPSSGSGMIPSHSQSGTHGSTASASQPALRQRCAPGANNPGSAPRSSTSRNSAMEDAKQGPGAQLQPSSGGQKPDAMAVAFTSSNLLAREGPTGDVTKVAILTAKPATDPLEAKEVAVACAAEGSDRRPSLFVPNEENVYDLADGDEDVCPICLEEYTLENPKILPTCGHSFHLQCICSWNERTGSRFCPTCAKLLVFEGADTLLSM